MQPPPSAPSSAAIAVIVALGLILLGVAIPALTFRYRRQDPSEKFPQFMRRVFWRRRK